MVPPDDFKWQDEEEDETVPCPAEWFSNASLNHLAAEHIGCTTAEVDELPIYFKLEALAYQQVMSKAKPSLERIAAQRAASKTTRETMKGGRRRR